MPRLTNVKVKNSKNDNEINKSKKLNPNLNSRPNFKPKVNSILYDQRRKGIGIKNNGDKKKDLVEVQNKDNTQ